MASRTPIFRVDIDGTDYTSRFRPLVKDIEVTDKDGLTSDTCSIRLADKDGQIALPQRNAKIEVWLGTSEDGVGLVFSGFVDGVRSSGSKGGGRELSVNAKGIDNRSKVKEQAQKYADEKTFGEVAKKWGSDAGLDGVSISEGLASISRKYWAMQGESYIHWAQRVAREIGATFKVQNNRGIFVDTNGGKTASGSDLPEIRAELGVNLETWEIEPFVGRPRHKKVKARYYDRKAAKWKEADADIADSDVEVEHTDRFTASDEDSANQKSRSLKGRSERNGGEGSVTILGTPHAKPEATCIVAGARPGIDGSYRIEGVTHKLDKRGYTTSLDLKQPHGEAGKDARKASQPSQSGGGSSANNPTPAQPQLPPYFGGGRLPGPV